MQIHRFVLLSAIILLQSCSRVFSTSLVKESSFKFKDCGHVRSKGFMKNGTYTLWLNDTTPFKVHCEHGASTSYTVILRRQDGSISFYRPLLEYSNRFGHPQYEYWAGLGAFLT
uniref:Fibrinogen C-terminal domain-containing protein n=1 Tax=Magallana gigas TaxID=29159 RepID=A0A8W8LRC9_MAGGI